MRKIIQRKDDVEATKNKEYSRLNTILLLCVRVLEDFDFGVFLWSAEVKKGITKIEVKNI